MKKISIAIFSILIALFLVISFNKLEPFLKYKLNNKFYKLITAENPTEWSRGLMFYKSKKELNGADGMLFIFPDKQMRSFWNKNTYLDLDVYWMNNDKVVGKDYLPSILKTKEPLTINSKKEVNKVVEIAR